MEEKNGTCVREINIGSLQSVSPIQETLKGGKLDVNGMRESPECTASGSQLCYTDSSPQASGTQQCRSLGAKSSYTRSNIFSALISKLLEMAEFLPYLDSRLGLLN